MNSSLLLISLLVVQLAVVAWLMWRSPFNPLAIVGLLTTVFSFLPAIILLTGSGFQSYSWRNFVHVDVADGTNAALMIGLLNSCLLLGGVAAEISLRRNPVTNAATSQLQGGAFLFGSRNLGLLSAVYFAVWLVVAALLYVRSGQTLTEFLLPIKETGVAAEQSGYLRSLYLAIPSALVVMSYWKHGSLRSPGWLWVLLALMATFSTHQRRELVTTALLILSLGMFLGPLYNKSKLSNLGAEFSANQHDRRMRLRVVGILLVGLMLVPILWYTRVYFTSRGAGSDVNVFEIRSFSDILLGSPTTGFPTFVLLQDFVADWGTNPLYLLAYPLTIFVPRALWDTKPTDLDTVVQSHYALTENPSSFWYGEIFYAFGSLAPIATFALAFFMYRLCLKYQTIPHIWYRTVGAIFFMQCVTLFKNGITVFVIRTMVLVVLLALAWFLCRPSRTVADFATQQRHPVTTR